MRAIVPGKISSTTTKLLEWLLTLDSGTVGVELVLGEETIEVIVGETLKVTVSREDVFTLLRLRQVEGRYEYPGAAVLSKAQPPEPKAWTDSSSEATQLSRLGIGDYFRHADNLPPGTFQVVGFEDGAPEDLQGAVICRCIAAPEGCGLTLGERRTFVGYCSVVRQGAAK